MKTQIVKAPTVIEFVSALGRLMDDAEAVCKMLVVMVDHNPKVYDEIVKADARITYNLLGNLERVGRGQMYFQMLIDNSPGARKLLSLPPSVQKSVYESPVKVVQFEKGKAVVVEKRIQQLSKKEADLAFQDNGRPRPVEMQVEIISTPAQPQSTPAQRYKIVGDKVVINHLEFDIATLEQILETLKANAIRNLGSTLRKNQIAA